MTCWPSWMERPQHWLPPGKAHPAWRGWEGSWRREPDESGLEPCTGRAVTAQPPSVPTRTAPPKRPSAPLTPRPGPSIHPSCHSPAGPLWSLPGQGAGCLTDRHQHTEHALGRPLTGAPIPLASSQVCAAWGLNEKPSVALQRLPAHSSADWRANRGAGPKGTSSRSTLPGPRPNMTAGEAPPRSRQRSRRPITLESGRSPRALHACGPGNATPLMIL